MGEIKYWRNL